MSFVTRAWEPVFLPSKFPVPNMVPSIEQLTLLCAELDALFFNFKLLFTFYILTFFFRKLFPVSHTFCSYSLVESRRALLPIFHPVNLPSGDKCVEIPRILSTSPLPTTYNGIVSSSSCTLSLQQCISLSISTRKAPEVICVLLVSSGLLILTGSCFLNTVLRGQRGIIDFLCSASY